MKRILHEPLFYLLPLLMLTYLTVIAGQEGGSVGGFKSLFLSDFIFVLLFLFSLFLILRKFKFQFITISIILFGIILRLILYTYTGHMQNTYDIDNHFHYIQIISEEKRIPKIDECRICYHPPLYYITASVVKSIADSYNSNLSDRFLQQCNLLLSFVCVILGIALILNLFGNCWAGYLAALVSVLWPGFVLTSPRINNDVLFYFGALFCMLFAQRYWRLYKKSDVLLASIGAAIALATKSNGFVILGVWVIIYILATLRSFKMDSLRVLTISILIIILSIVFSNYRSIINVFEGKKVELVENINTMGNTAQVENTMGNYLYLDLKDYFLEPYVSTQTDAGGRQYFWNYAIKTSYLENLDCGILTSGIYLLLCWLFSLYLYFYLLCGVQYTQNSRICLPCFLWCFYLPRLFIYELAILILAQMIFVIFSRRCFLSFIFPCAECKSWKTHDLENSHIRVCLLLLLCLLCLLLGKLCNYLTFTAKADILYIESSLAFSSASNLLLKPPPLSL
jgi:hypothetical protein